MRGPPVCLRDLTAEEASAVESLARSRTAPARRVERARIVWCASHGETPPTIAGTLGLSAETVRRRIHRFNAVADACQSEQSARAVSALTASRTRPPGRGRRR